MTGNDELILDLLSSRGFISEKQTEEVRHRAEEKNVSAVDALAELQYMSEDQVMMILASEYGMDTFDLSDYKIPAEAVKAVPADVARQYRVVPVMNNDGTVIVAMADPTDLETLDALRYILKTDVEGVIAPKKQIEQARVMGATGFQIALKVLLPSSMVWVFNGLKVAVPYSLLAALGSEMVASTKGVGFLILQASQVADTNGVFAYLIMIVLLTLLINTALGQFKRWALRWQG